MGPKFIYVGCNVIKLESDDFQFSIMHGTVPPLPTHTH